MFNVYMLITVYLVNLLRLTFNTPKKSSLLSPPLCSSRPNVRVCFHTMRSVSSQKHIFEIFALHTFQTPAFSSPVFSTPAVWCRVFQSRVFQSRVFSRPLPDCTYEIVLRKLWNTYWSLCYMFFCWWCFIFERLHALFITTSCIGNFQKKRWN